MKLSTLCPLCDQEIPDHNKIFIDGDEAFACYESSSDEETKKMKIMDWIEKLERDTEQ